jgi:hypothetical protein
MSVIENDGGRICVNDWVRQCHFRLYIPPGENLRQASRQLSWPVDPEVLIVNMLFRKNVRKCVV